MWRVGFLFFGSLASLLIFADGETDQQQASALNSFFTDLKSPGQLQGWSSSGGDPCGNKWKGVTCNGNQVTEINLSGLGLSGSLQGYVLQELVSLTTLDLSNNNINGSIPNYGFPQTMRRLDLSGNGIVGTLPWFTFPSLEYLSLSRNTLEGNVNDMFGTFSKLSTLDLSSNSFSGNLPWTFSNLSSLSTLYLQNNQLTGSIDVLADLPLQYLNVANNKFSGSIPDKLKGIKSFQSDGNQWQGGQNPKSKGSNGGDIQSNDGGKSGIGGGAIAGIVISLLVVVSMVVAFFLFRRRKPKFFSDNIRKPKESHAPLAPSPRDEEDVMKPSSIFSSSSPVSLQPPTPLIVKPPPVDRHHIPYEENDTSYRPIPQKVNKVSIDATTYSVADLQLATDSFSTDNILGEGSVGRVYKARFNDGKVLAVKKINSSVFSNKVSGDFMEVASCVSQLHHPNVTELMGYCAEHGQHLLVYEYHGNGSLYDFLYLSDEYSKPLTWNTRVKIALGSARALEYLHEVCSPRITHKNFKSTNILLDGELNPHLSDCGLSKLITNVDSQALDEYIGSGYCAPEVAMSGQYTLKSDVFSFGVVMLELLTGRMPFDSSRARAEQSLFRWASPQLHDIDALDKMVDPALKGLYPAKSLSRFADVIALCLQTEPEFRPPMSDVVQQLVRLVQRANISKKFGAEKDRHVDETYMEELL